MIFKILKKEWGLSAHPNLFIFTCMGPLLLVPAYPLSMIFLFSCLGVFVSFMFNRETQDLYFTALLPLAKGKVVLGKFLLVISAQLATFVLALPFAVLRHFLIQTENPVGLEVNVNWFTVGFLIFSSFNFVFLPKFFKTGYQVGVAFLWALPFIITLSLLAEVIGHFPTFDGFKATNLSAQISQIPYLIGAILLYWIGNFYSYKKSQKNFQKVNL